MYAVPTTIMDQRPTYLFYTLDGGEHWQLQSEGAVYPPSSSLPPAPGHTPSWVVGDLFVSGSQSAQVLDFALAGDQPTIAYTDDAAVSWTERSLPDVPHGTLADGAIAVLGNRWWIIWFDGTLVRLVTTVDQGAHWSFQSL
jgi:photosystem II stability/assembly factor-like uncharacterized protein